MPGKAPKTNLSSRSPNSGRSLDVYGQAQALVQAAAPFISRFSRFDRKLGGQLKSALPSVMLNLAEGLRRVGGDRNHLITVALGSTDEVQSIFDVGRALGIVSAAEALTVHEPADRVCAMAQVPVPQGSRGRGREPAAAPASAASPGIDSAASI